MRLFAALLIAGTLACAAGLFARAQDASGYQHIADGGFEGGAGGWSTTHGAALDVVSADVAVPADGARSARLTLVDTASGAMHHRVDGALPPGAYTLTLQARSDAPGGVVAIYLGSLAAGTWERRKLAEAPAGGAWSALGASFALQQAAEARVEITFTAQPGDALFVDAVSLDGAAPVTFTPTPTQTPVPSELLGATPAPGTPTVAATLTATATATVEAMSRELRNPGFEDVDEAGAPRSWDKYGGTLSASGPARTGGRAALLESSTTATKWLYQAVVVDGGAWYDFAAWVLHDDPAVARASLRISWYASADGSGEAIATSDSPALDEPSGQYRHLSTGSVQAPAGARTARLRILLAPVSSAAASILADDASFGPSAPAPAATATVAAQARSRTTGVAPAAGAATDGDGPARRRARTSASGRGATASRALGASGPDGIVINEVLYDPAGDAPDGDAEWVELYNASDQTVDLAGWALGDAQSVDLLPPTVVPPGTFVVIAASDAFRSEYPSYRGPLLVLGTRIGNGLGNDGDVLDLLDPSGAVVDAVSWGDDVSAFEPPVEDVPEGHSIERRVAGEDTDAAADFVDNHRPSPGAAFVAGRADVHSQGSTGSSGHVLDAADGRAWAWLPWALAATFGALCGGAVCWRTYEAVRARLQAP